MQIELHAQPGKIWTNGKTHGLDITLEEGLTGDDYYEIDYAEYEEIINRQRIRQMEGMFGDFDI